MSSRSAARGRAAASSIRLTSRTSKAVATRRASPSRCFLFWRGSRAARSAPTAAATVSIPPIPGLSRLTAHPLQSHQGTRTPGNLRAGKGCRHAHLDAELIGLVSLAFPDALDLGRMQRINLATALALALILHPVRERERQGEDL